jgi:DNA-binding SARP family transcriptional activator
VQFKVFGQVEISNGRESLVLGRSKVGQMLSLLLARSNETVGVDVLIDELWGERVPRSALTTLQTYVYHARKMFSNSLMFPQAERVLITRPPGYMISVDESALDASLFERRVEEGTGFLTSGDAEAAVTCLTEALRLSRGPVFAGMTIGTVLHGHVTYLHELRLTALGLRVEAHQRLGRHRQVIPELRSMVSENPLNEGFHAQLIGALHQCGRRAEALQAYQRLWQILKSELGVAPSTEVQRLYQEVVG